MEAILLSLIPYVIPIVGTLLIALISYGIAVLKRKARHILSEEAIAALDQVNHIVGTVVGSLAQTTAKGLRAAAKDGHLTKGEKHQLKANAVLQVKCLISDQVSKAASASIDDLTSYIQHKVEEKVLTQGDKLRG